MKNIFNQTWKYFAGGATVLAYGAWLDRMKNPERVLALKKDINSNIDSVKDKISDLQEKISSTVDTEMRTQLIAKYKELKKEIKSMKDIHNKYFEKFENGSVSTDPEGSLSLYERYKKEINEVFSKANNKANEISDILSNTSAERDKFMDNNPIFYIIKDFKEYLASLSIMEICLVVNIFSCVFIITCIISILFAVFGNYLIDRFALEQKFPKLSRIIQLRVKLQRYYVIINSVLIILALLSLILVNTITLING